MPKLSVRKTLIIGIGTTGREIAEAVAQSLKWQFGGLEQTPWVRLLVVETEDVSSEILGDRLLWIGIHAKEYESYINSPRTAGSDFGFADWHDSATLSKVANPGSGAGGLRMMGRLTLMHSYARLRKRTLQELSELGKLTPASLQYVSSPDTLIDPTGETVVYVVGTLCGGTCSGGATDLGYFLKIWDSNVKRQAVFTLPHPSISGGSAARFKSNAYHAIQELNHYQLHQNSYRQKLPGTQVEVKPGSPYDILRVVMPKAGASTAVGELNAAIAQYLVAASGYAGQEIVASDADAITQMDNMLEMGFMRPLFSTLGVAALEFPGEHIQRAATARLLAGTLKKWTGNRIDKDDMPDMTRMLGADSLETLLHRLTEGAEKLSVVEYTELTRPSQAGEPVGIERVRQLVRDREGRLETVTLPLGDTTLSTLPALAQVINDNRDRFLRGLIDDVHHAVRDNLIRWDGGPAFLTDLCTYFSTQIERWSRELEDNLPDLQQDSQSLQEMLNQHIEKVEAIRRSPNPFGKEEKLRNGWSAVHTGMEDYFRVQLKLKALSFLQRRQILTEMFNVYRENVARILRRLAAMQTAFVLAAGQQREAWEVLAVQAPSLSGRVYYIPGKDAHGTLTQEYEALLKRKRWDGESALGWDFARKEEEAQRDTLTALAPLVDELFCDEGKSRFDPHSTGENELDRIKSDMILLEARARAFFDPLRQSIHVVDKVEASDIVTLVTESKPRLQYSETQISERLSGVQSGIPIEINLAMTQTHPDSPVRQQRLGERMEQLNRELSLRRDRVLDSDDPYRILLLQEVHGFTMGQMIGVIKDNPHDNQSLQTAAETCRDFPYWFTRKDVDWRNPLTPPSRVKETEEEWLVFLLTGRADDKVTRWLPSRNQEIDATGWYKVTEGGFHVYPLAGTGYHSGDTAKVLPHEFAAAVAYLLSPDRDSLRGSLAQRTNSFRDRYGAARTIEVMAAGYDALGMMGLNGSLSQKDADAILRRKIQRHSDLTNAFFALKTRDMEQGRAEFSQLWKEQGTAMPLEGTYSDSAYYCPQCNHPLGTEPGDLLAGHFTCPSCAVPYWPVLTSTESR